AFERVARAGRGQHVRRAQVVGPGIEAIRGGLRDRAPQDLDVGPRPAVVRPQRRVAVALVQPPQIAPDLRAPPVGGPGAGRLRRAEPRAEDLRSALAWSAGGLASGVLSASLSGTARARDRENDSRGQEGRTE